MDKIHINLLPVEILSQQIEKNKKSTVVKVAIFVLIVMIVLTAGILSLSVSRNNEHQKLAAQLAQLEQSYNANAQTGNIMSQIKEKLNKISTRRLEDVNQVEAFNLMVQLLTSGVRVNTLSLGKSSEVILSGEVDSTSSLELFFNNLTDPSKNGNKISKVSIQSLSKTAQDNFRFDIGVNLR